MFDNLPCPTFCIRADSTIRRANARALDFIGLAADQIIGREVLSLYTDVPEGRARAAKLYTRFKAGKPIADALVGYERGDGRVRWGRLWAQPILDEAGNVVESRSVVIDVTAHQETEAAVRRREHRFSAAFRFAPRGMALVDAGGSLVDVNLALCELVGRPAQDLIGTPVWDLVSPDEAPSLEERVGRHSAGRQPSIDLQLMGADGRAPWVRITSAGLGLPNEAATAVLHVEDITEARGLREALHQASTHDALTGLLNRRGLMELARQLLAAADRDSRPVAVIFIDVDGLKAVNDRHGHAAGDRALVAVAELLQQTFRRADVVARYGGDEFCVLLDATDEAGVRGLLDRLRGAGAVDTAGQNIPDVSTGHFIREPCSGVGIQQALANADRAMYDGRRRRPGIGSAGHSSRGDSLNVLRHHQAPVD